MVLEQFISGITVARQLENGCYSYAEAKRIILYGICKNLTVMQINELLFDYGLETL